MKEWDAKLQGLTHRQGPAIDLCYASQSARGREALEQQLRGFQPKGNDPSFPARQPHGGFFLSSSQKGRNCEKVQCNLNEQFSEEFHSINLLEEKWESRYLSNPDLLAADLKALKPSPRWVVIDEIQKVPKLLDVVHHLIESTNYKFIMTGSSARKLRRGSGNLLAGRAFNYQMHPFTHNELGERFSLDLVLRWGSLPSVVSMNDEERTEYLRSYCQTYLKEEILQEQIVRNGQAFRSFLEVAAQENGKTLNFSKVARDIDVDTKTAQSFFQILEDTLVGFFLPAFSRSSRKSVKLQPKFYLFDLGVKKALERSLQQEIKSTDSIDPIDVAKVARVAKPLKPTKVFYVSQDPTRSLIDGVHCLHWTDFLAMALKS